MSSNSLSDTCIHSIGGGWGADSPDTVHTEYVAVIRGTDIPRIRMGVYSSVPRRYEAARRLKNRLLQVGDIVLEVSGGSASSGQHTGRALLITEKILAGMGTPPIPASFCRLLRLDPEKVDPAFVVYQINEMHLSGEIASFEQQSTGIANFQFERFIREVSPRVESKKQQAAISEVLATFDDRITLLRETNKTLESIAQAIFKSWFVDFDPVRAKMEGRQPDGMDEETAALFPDSFEESELGLIPRGWQVETVGDVIDTQGGATPSTKNKAFWEPEEFNWTTPKDLSGAVSPILLDTERRISAAGLAKISSGLLPSGTLLMSSRAPIGYLTLCRIPVAVNQGYIAMPPGGKLPPLFMYFWCKTNMDVIKGRANGSTFMEISKKAFRPIPIISPPNQILAPFMAVAKSMFDKISVNTEQASILAHLRDVLLPRLISGQIRLPDAEQRIEAALS